MKFKKVSGPFDAPTYAVIVEGEVIGTVTKYTGELYDRTSDRLRGYLYWRDSDRLLGRHEYDTRKAAAEALLKNKEGEGVTA